MLNYSGVSAFAFMNHNFPIEAFLATSDFAPQPTLAVLWGTFGDSTPESTARFKKFTDRYHDKKHMIEIHPINNTAIRNKKQYEGEPFPQYDIARFNAALERNDPATLATVTQRIQEIRSVMEEVRNENTYLVMTTGLEDDYTTKAFQNIYAEMVKTWPYFIIRCGAAVSNFPRETHGKNATAGGSVVFVNEDGYVSSLSESKKFVERNKSAMCTLLWRPQHQGRDPNTNSFPPGSPRDRTFIWTAEDVVSLGLLLGPMPAPGPTPPPNPPDDPLVCPVPLVPQSTVPGGGYPLPGPTPPPVDPGIGKICPSVSPLVTGVLWKPESQDTGDARQGKPVLIFKTQKPGKEPLKVYASNGTQIGSLGYYGEYEGNGARYYAGYTGGSGDTSQTLQTKAVAASGSQKVYVKLPTGCIGPIVPTQRTGSL